MWNIKEKLQVSNANSAIFTANEEEMAVLQKQDPEGNDIIWH